MYAMALFGAFSIFESGGITKHLMTGPSGNSEFCFPSTSTGNCHVQLVLVNELAVIVDLSPFYTSVDD